MAIAFDAVSASTADLASGTPQSHGGGASARAVTVCVSGVANATPSVTAIDYGGVALANIQQNSDTSETGNTMIWWADNIPTGTQDVTVTHAGQIRIAVYTMTVTAGQVVAVDTTAGQDTTTSSNPAWNMTTTTGRTTFCVEVITSGLQTMTTTPATNWTAATTTGLDRGAQGWGSARRSPNPTGGVVACGWTAATSDDWCGSSAAFYEAAPPAPTSLIWEFRRVKARTPRMTANPGLSHGRRP